MSATVPPIIYVVCSHSAAIYNITLSLYCHSAARPIRARTRTLFIYYIEKLLQQFFG